MKQSLKDHLAALMEKSEIKIISRRDFFVQDMDLFFDAERSFREKKDWNLLSQVFGRFSEAYLDRLRDSESDTKTLLLAKNNLLLAASLLSPEFAQALEKVTAPIERSHKNARKKIIWESLSQQIQGMFAKAA